MNIKITKKQYQYLTEAMDLDFSFAELDSLPVDEKESYCRKHLGNSFSNGSARKCYMLDDSKILKLAYNERGYAQNKVEVDMIKKANSFLLPKIYEYASDGSYIVMEHVLPCTYEDFEKVLGIPFKNKWRQNSEKQQIMFKKGDTTVGYNKYFDGSKEPNEDFNGKSVLDIIWYIGDIYVYGDVENYSPMDSIEFEKIISDNPWFGELKRLSRQYGLTDLEQMENYGLTKRNGKMCIVLLDCGLDYETFQEFYA